MEMKMYRNVYEILLWLSTPKVFNYYPSECCKSGFLLRKKANKCLFWSSFWKIELECQLKHLLLLGDKAYTSNIFLSCRFSINSLNAYVTVESVSRTSYSDTFVFRKINQNRRLLSCFYPKFLKRYSLVFFLTWPSHILTNSFLLKFYYYVIRWRMVKYTHSRALFLL
jgi:hypothetical protein